MANLQPVQRKALNDLRASYARHLPERIDTLQAAAEAAMTHLRAGAPDGPRQAVDGLFHLSHQLAGSSGTLGFTSVAEAARRLEALVESIAENHGDDATDFRLEIIKLLDEIKRASQRDATRPPAAARRATRAKAGPGETTLKLRATRRKRSNSALPGSRPWPTVLLVDDDESTLTLEALQLRGARVRVETARSGNEALGKVLAQPPDLIIADVKMDGMSGYELCRLVRTMGQRDVPFIFLSALGAAPERIMGLRMGADDYIVKPVNGEELLLKVRRQLEKARRLRVLQKDR